MLTGKCEADFRPLKVLYACACICEPHTCQACDKSKAWRADRSVVENDAEVPPPEVRPLDGKPQLLTLSPKLLGSVGVAASASTEAPTLPHEPSRSEAVVVRTPVAGLQVSSVWCDPHRRRLSCFASIRTLDCTFETACRVLCLVIAWIVASPRHSVPYNPRAVQTHAHRHRTDVWVIDRDRQDPDVASVHGQESLLAQLPTTHGRCPARSIPPPSGAAARLSGFDARSWDPDVRRLGKAHQSTTDPQGKAQRSRVVTNLGNARRPSLATSCRGPGLLWMAPRRATRLPSALIQRCTSGTLDPADDISRRF